QPNNIHASKSLNKASLLPRPIIQPPRSTPSTTRPPSKTPGEQPAPFTAPPSPTRSAPQFAEPPKIESAANNPLANSPIAMPQIQPEEKPKLAFETPGGPPPSPRTGTGKLNVPSGSISDAVRSMPRSGSGGVMVGDIGTGM